jgi:hypothetical protein
VRLRLAHGAAMGERLRQEVFIAERHANALLEKDE